jgi:apolipoprotein N-acyltransferase
MYRSFLAIISGLLLGLSFYGQYFNLLAWVALVPLLLAIRGRSMVASFSLAFLAGLCFYPVWSPWLLVPSSVRFVDALLVWSYCSVYFGLFGVLYSFAERSARMPLLVSAPAAWVTSEFLRSNASYLAMPLSQVGHSQYQNLELIQVASITGVYGLTFLIVMTNVLIAGILVWRKLPVRQVSMVLVLMAVVLGYGSWRLSIPATGEVLALSVIQPNIPQHQKWGREFRDENMARHVELSREAARTQSGSLIVWPEAAITGFLQKELALSLALSELARDTGSFLLAGGAGRPKIGSHEFRNTTAYNSAFLVNPEGQITQQYSKILPLPFGEYVPYKDWFPWPEYYIQSTGNYSPGTEYTIFDADGLRFGTVICWEMYFPQVAREFIRNGAQLLVNITNEAWFGDSDASRQFFAVSVFRAVENGVSVARAANTGISGFVDPYGRITGVVEQEGKTVEVEGFHTASVPLRSGMTFYSRFGDVFALANLAFCSLILLWRLRRIPIRVLRPVRDTL